jgi:IclR family transcriptional regulator, acetate operon repressor
VCETTVVADPALLYSRSIPSSSSERDMPADRERLADRGSGKSAERALAILEFLARRTNPTPTMIISASCDIPKSSLHTLLNLMRASRFVTYHERERAWSLGPRLFEISGEAPLLAHALAVFAAFEHAPHALTVHEIVELSGLPAATVARILPMLEGSSLLMLHADGRYALGLQLVTLASRVGDLDRLRMTARARLVELRDATGETANLVVREGDHALYIDQVESRHALRHTGWTGRRIPLTQSAAGAAFDGAAGPHVASNAVEEGVTAVACAIPGAVDPPAVISVTAPSFRLSGQALASACAAVERAAESVGVLLKERRRTG